ncbi:MAG TPA: 4Fe-4S binding protein [Bacteroidales bacterium]|nr:4Fe-4S binding protein [Bacteroidales bacterium]
MKQVRIVVSLLVMTMLVLVFLDSNNRLPDFFTTIATYLQFIPSVLHFVAAAGWLAAGFIVVTLLTLLFGRVYCSFLCPLGTLQDFIIRISGWFKSRKQRFFTFRRPLGWLHYSLLIIIATAAVSGIVLPLGLLDPFSVFGRIMTHLVRPVFVQANNLLSDILQSLSSYSVNPLEYLGFHFASLAIAIGILAVVAVFAAVSGRQYCNTVCPAGAFLRFLSKFSLYRLRLNHEFCTGCGLCERSCKAGCINSKERSIDFARCIACYNCIGACPSVGVGYAFSMKRISKPVAFDPSRRNFVKISALTALSGSGLTALTQPSEGGLGTTVPEEKEFAVSPPGSISHDHFNNKCIACHLCVSKCPKQVLQPTLLQYGLEGFLQPHLDFRTSFCNFDCVICGEVCPTGAIKPLTVETKHITQIGKAFFIRPNCIVRTDWVDCGACSEHCPTKAVQMIPWQRGLWIPQVTRDICIGCGACEYACPTKPYKAIYVDGNPVHKIADRPVVNEKPLLTPSATDDFPF